MWVLRTGVACLQHPHPDLLKQKIMKNIGPKSKEWLASVGIHSLDDVAELGVVETYRRVKAAYPEKVSLNLLYGLQAALLDIKNELKRQVGESS